MQPSNRPVRFCSASCAQVVALLQTVAALRLDPEEVRRSHNQRIPAAPFHSQLHCPLHLQLYSQLHSQLYSQLQSQVRVLLASGSRSIRITGDSFV